MKIICSVLCTPHSIVLLYVRCSFSIEKIEDERCETKAGPPHPLDGFQRSLFSLSCPAENIVFGVSLRLLFHLCGTNSQYEIGFVSCGVRNNESSHFVRRYL